MVLHKKEQIMGKDALIQVRIDAEKKRQAEAFFEAMGMSLSDGVRIFVSHCVARQRFPFEIQPSVKEAKGNGFGILKSYASAAQRGSEREAWINSLISAPDVLIGNVDGTTNIGGDKAYRIGY